MITDRLPAATAGSSQMFIVPRNYHHSYTERRGSMWLISVSGDLRNTRLASGWFLLIAEVKYACRWRTKLKDKDK